MATPQFTLTGNLKNLLNAADAGYLQISLSNYGSAIPSISGTGLVANTIYNATADGSGNFSVTLWGNDQISPTNTYYVVRVFSTAGGQSQAVAYQFLGTGSFDITALTPLLPVNLAAYVPNAIVSNPTAAQTIFTYPLGVTSLTASGSVLVGNGLLTNVSCGFISEVNTGLWRPGVNQPGMAVAGTDVMTWTSTGAKLGSGGIMSWSSLSGASASTPDTSISRVAPGQIGVGNGTPGDTTGLVDASSFYIAGDLMRMDTTGLRLNNVKVVGWSSTTAAGVAFDTGLSRTAAGVVAAGNGGAADTSGTFAGSRFLFAGSDAALSRTAVATVAVGNGTAGDFSGTVKAAKYLANDGSAAAPSFAFTNNTGSGIYNVAGTISFAVSGALKAFINGNINLATNSGMYTFGASNDTGLSRTAAAEISVGNGVSGNAGGTLIANAIKGGTLSSINAAGLIVMGSLSDTGLSRISAGLIGVGNGTASDFSGTLKAASYQATSNYVFTGFTTTGLNINAGDGSMQLKIAGTNYWSLFANQLRQGSGSVMGWSSVADPASASPDTGFSRIGVGQVGLGNGTASDVSGSFNAANIIQSADFARLNSSGIKIASNGTLGFVNTTNSSGTTDVGISRTAAGEIGVGNGSNGDSSGALKLNKITGYAGTATAGLGIPFILNSTQVTGVTASTGTVTLVASAPVGTYEASVYLYPTTVGTGGNATLNIAYNNGSFAHSFTTNSLVLSASGVVQNVFVLKSAAAQAITYAITITGATGSPVVAADIIIRKIL